MKTVTAEYADEYDAGKMASRTKGFGAYLRYLFAGG